MAYGLCSPKLNSSYRSPIGTTAEDLPSDSCALHQRRQGGGEILHVTIAMSAPLGRCANATDDLRERPRLMRRDQRQRPAACGAQDCDEVGG